MSTPPPADPTPATPGVPAGWYPDPGNGQQRWWDGKQWTTTFAVNGVVQQLMSAPSPLPRSTTNWGSLSLVLGVAAVLAIFSLGMFRGADILTLVLAAAAILVASVSFRVSRTKSGAGRGLAVAGLVLGILVIVIVAVIVAIAFRYR